jgi:hypothetical protein
MDSHAEPDPGRRLVRTRRVRASDGIGMKLLSSLTTLILENRISVEQARDIVLTRAAASREKEQTSWKRVSRKRKTYDQRFTEWIAA